ncbi:hypothetical protein KAF25_001918 [Fusarium avenaceum]|uniref:Heterokaryon incompatibility domain-containing protein n=1 Tax=Fusarium avenaceum TaxID=40199 RepID=A0A9P7GTM3_9HYPO|nr:hypothetical protein KAF25_001918 [Fusarium avenaceum]
MSSSHHSPYPEPSSVRASAKAIAKILGSTQSYAVVGGAACLLLGSERTTSDLDFVVPKGETKMTRALLRNHPDIFSIDKRTLHTNFLSEPPVEVEILAPPKLFQEEFSSSTSVVKVEGVRVLKPTLILNAKCASILSRANSAKKDTDAYDIQFLLQWCAASGVFPTSQDVPNASLQFIQWFIHEFGDQELWIKAGFDLKTAVYDYPLPGPGWFRLLVIEPWRADKDRFKCHLRAVRIDNAAGKYSALSYCWAQPVCGAVQGLVCNGFAQRCGIVWVDALCISQNDLAERSQQVQLMGDIYKQAVETIIWLGDVFPCGPARPEFDSICEVVKAWNKSLRPSYEARNAKGKLCRYEPDISKGRSGWSNVAFDANFVATVFGCPWFERRWVIQEVALASSAVVKVPGATMQ